MGNDAYNNMMEGDKADLHDLWVRDQEDLLRREMIDKLGWDLERFPLPICFDPHEERKQLGGRMKRIIAIVDRYINISRIRFEKQHK